MLEISSGELLYDTVLLLEYGRKLFISGYN